MDIRSFVLNAEISLLIYDLDFTRSVQQLQARDLRNSRPLTAAEWQRRGRLIRAVQNLCRLFSPLL